MEMENTESFFKVKLQEEVSSVEIVQCIVCGNSLSEDEDIFCYDCVTKIV